MVTKIISIKNYNWILTIILQISRRHESAADKKITNWSPLKATWHHCDNVLRSHFQAVLLPISPSMTHSRVYVHLHTVTSARHSNQSYQKATYVLVQKLVSPNFQKSSRQATSNSLRYATIVGRRLLYVKQRKSLIRFGLKSFSLFLLIASFSKVCDNDFLCQNLCCIVCSTFPSVLLVRGKGRLSTCWNCRRFRHRRLCMWVPWDI